MTLDFPTPPLPDATAITVVFPSVKNCGCSGRPPRSEVTSAPRWSSDIVPRTTWTCSTPVERRDGAGDVGLDAVPQRAAVDGEQDRHGDGVAVDPDVLQHADVLDRLADLGIQDVPQRGADLFLGGHGLFSRVGSAFAADPPVVTGLPSMIPPAPDRARDGREGIMAGDGHRRSPEIHKALADDTRFRLYRYVGARRPAGLRPRDVARGYRCTRTPSGPTCGAWRRPAWSRSEIRKGGSVGRPRTLYLGAASPRTRSRATTGCSPRCSSASCAGSGRSSGPWSMARDWGAYLVAQGKPKPGARPPAGINLALLQDAMARAGFDPRFRRTRRQGGRDHAPGLPVPRPGRRAPRAGVHAASRAARGDRGGRVAAARPAFVPAVRRAQPVPGDRGVGRRVPGIVVRPLEEPDRAVGARVPARPGERDRRRPRHAAAPAGASRGSSRSPATIVSRC